MSKKIKILTPRIYEHSDFFHNAVDFAREHSLNTNELCLELSHYLVDNFEKIWKVEKPRVYKKLADLEAKLAESEKKFKASKDAIKFQSEEQKEWMDKYFDTAIKLEKANKQLSEKEKAYQELLNSIQIEDLSNINFIQVNEDIIRFSQSGVLYEYNQKENKIYKIIDQAHQDKISFCIEKLEKVRSFAYNTFKEFGCFDETDLEHILDNQIEELKKEMK